MFILRVAMVQRRLLILAAVLAAAVLAPASARATCAPGECPSGGGHKVHKDKPWALDNLYKVEHSGAAVVEPHVGAAAKAVHVAAGTWLPIACQVTTYTGNAPMLWDRIANVGWVPDSWLKTFRTTPLVGAPTCAVPHPDHVWNLQSWSRDARYHVERTSAGWHQPKREGIRRPHWIRAGGWVKISCQVRGQSVGGSRLWDKVAGQYVPDGALKTWTVKSLTGAPRCHVKPSVSTDAGHFVALGDSYSSGEGAGDYLPNLSFRSKPCDRSVYAWSRTLRDAWLPPRTMSDASDFLACQGDVTSDVLSKQIPHMRRRATAVTITIGGNDMGFSSIIKACLANFDCPKAVRNHFGPIARHSSTAKLRALAAKLARTYVAIRRRAPHATVVVVGYPDVVGDHIDGCFGLSDGDLPMLHLAEKRLNDTIHSVVRKRGKNFHFVSLAGVFAGHEACSGSSDLWINTPNKIQYFREYFHPNYEGQQAIASAVKRTLPKLFSQL